MNVPALRALGLGPDAEVVYVTLLKEPHLNVADLGHRLGLSEPDVRTALDELVGLTLLRVSREGPGRLRPVEPAVGLEAILRRQEEDLAARQQELATNRARVAEFLAQRPSASIDGAERLIGIDAIHTRLETLARELRGECLAVMPGGAQSQESLDASLPLDREALARCVALRNLYQDTARRDSPTLAYARWLIEQGGEVRTAPLLPPRMVIFDRAVAVIPINPHNTRLGALCTSEAAVVASMVTIFDQAWAEAAPIDEESALGESQELTGLERQLLRLLALGLTDEAAGRRLGTSGRTVRRQVAALMDRLGASSRFEAGQKAQQRGWI